VQSEHTLEVQLTHSPALRKSFPCPISQFRRQLPVGLFKDNVSTATSLTPAKASQVDMWGMSIDGKTAHLVELKASGNTSVGILPEALYYARLLHKVRVGEFLGGGKELDALRSADRIIMWLIAPHYHPLIYSFGTTPLIWFNDAMLADAVELRILPIDVDATGCTGWRTRDMWPRISDSRKSE
jgi:hypothetical protein